MAALPRFSTRTSSVYDSVATPPKPTVEKIDIAPGSAVLPPPAVQYSPGGSQGSRRKQRTRFRESASRQVKKQWERVLRKFGTGAAPTASEEDIETESIGELPSSMYGCYKPSRKRLEAADEIDEVVVDREWGEDVRSSSEHSGHGEKSGVSGQHGHSGSDADSVADHDDHHCVGNSVIVYLRYRLLASVRAFFVTKFMDEKSEEQYRRESWFLRKVRSTWHLS